MKKEDALFQTEFFRRFSHKRCFFLLAATLVCGVFGGSAAAVCWELFRGQQAFPLFFSGIPVPESGFLACFSTVLLNTLIGLIILFLLGVTAFGALGVPFFLLSKGGALGIGVLYFMASGSFDQVLYCALGYTPAAAVSTLLLLLFAVRSLAFSNSLAKAGFSSRQESLDFQVYFKDFLTFLCFSVVTALAGGLLAVLCGAILK